ncbi:MAG: DUF433 domain-containing protein [Synechococcaceae cyanobacterium]|jgi:uncharacterized protein (DUF433 family)|nr:DUF433 domain-containing protein [Synechococcaceae cyanobacterium]
MNLLERITIDPAVRFGKPCVRGTRLTVGDVLGNLAAGSTEAELLEDFPQLSHEDVLACLAFAAEREKRLITSPAAV